MTIADYINWELTNDEMNEYSNYFMNKQSTRNQLAFNSYNKILLERFYQSQEGVDEYLNIARTFVSNEYFNQALTNMINKLQMPTLSNRQIQYIEDIQKALKRDINLYQTLIKQIDQAVTAITSALGQLDPDELLPDDGLEEKLIDIYGNELNHSDNRIIQNKDLSSTFIGQYRYLLSLLPDFQALKNSKTANDESLILLSKILTPIQTLMGVASEYQSEIELNAVIDTLIKDFDDPHIKITRVGDIKDKDTTGKGFRVGTADLSITMSQGQSNMSFALPDLGVSLKRTRLQKKGKDHYHVQLKGTTYGSLFQEIDPAIVTAFYNLYANTAPVLQSGEQQKPVPSATLTAAYKYMKAASLTTALIGNANAKDLVAIFVINNQPFTIFDLLEALAKEEDNSTKLAMKPSLSRGYHDVVKDKHIELYKQFKPNQKNKRSSGIRKFINSRPVKYSITLSAAMLRGLGGRI